jgi:hypothetical protein
LIASVLLAASLAVPCFAQSDADRALARRLATGGVEAYEQRSYAVAAEKLEKAYQILKVPSVALWLARALSEQGRLVAAAERYAEATRLPTNQGDSDVQQAAQRDAAKELDALTPQIPTLVIQVPGVPAAELKLSLDGTVLPSAVLGEQQPIDPGKHHVEARYRNQVKVADAQLSRGQSRTAVLKFELQHSDAPADPDPVKAPDAPVAAAVEVGPTQTPPTDRPPISQRTAGYALGGLGLSGLVVGGVFGYLAIQAKQTQNDRCSSPSSCPSHADAVTAHDAAQTRGTVSTVAFIVGAAASTIGVVLIATAKSPEHAPAAARLALCTNVSPGAAHLQIAGEF